MYNTVGEIVNISGFKAYPKLFLCKDNTVFLNSKIIQSHIDVTSLTIFNQNLFFTSNSERKFYYFENKVIEYNYSAWLNTLFENTVLVYEYFYEDRLFDVFVYDFVQKKVVSRIKDRINVWDLFRKGNDLYLYDSLKTTLKSLSLITGEYEWETPINRSGEIFKILGVRDNELVVCWKRGEKLFGLLGIDIQTGEIVWNIDNNQLLNGHSLYFTDNQQSLFSTKGTNHNSYFIEIDLLSKQAIRFGEIEDLCKAQVEISRSQYKDGLIYFTASTHHDIFPDIIGVLDYKALKVLWQHRFDFDRLTHLKNFEVTEDKLYVLDSKDPLHIFEKEQA